MDVITIEEELERVHAYASGFLPHFLTTCLYSGKIAMRDFRHCFYGHLSQFMHPTLHIHSGFDALQIQQDLIGYGYTEEATPIEDALDGVREGDTVDNSGILDDFAYEVRRFLERKH